MNHHRALAQMSAKLIFLAFFGVCSSFAQPAARALLSHLEGDWVMTGTVMKEPVQYTAQGSWALGKQFLSLHMTDTSSPPKYEAMLYIGIDSAKNEYVGHWLDVFGGAGARVVGIGPIASGRVEIVYPYAEGRFRNLFTYDSTGDRWKLIIESERQAGKGPPFAEYTITRSRPGSR